MRISKFVVAGVVVCAGVMSGQSRLLVAVKGTQNLAIVDPASGSVVATVPEGGTTGHEVIASADGKRRLCRSMATRAWASRGRTGTRSRRLILLHTRWLGDIRFNHGVRPHCPLIRPKDGLLYVTTELDKTITIIDPKTLKVLGALPTGQEQSHMMVLSHDGKRAYTANVGPGTVSVIDVPAAEGAEGDSNFGQYAADLDVAG